MNMIHRFSSFFDRASRSVVVDSRTLTHDSVVVGYNKFASECKPPPRSRGYLRERYTSLRTRSSSAATYDVMKFVRLMTASLTSAIPMLVCETLILLSDAGLQCQVQLAPTDGLDKQLMRSFLMRETIFICEIDQGQGQPTGKIDGGAELIDVTLSENDGDLNSTLPTSFLDVKHTGGGEGSSLHRLRSDKQGHAKLGRFWCMLNGHGRHCTMIARLNGRLIDGLAVRR